MSVNLTKYKSALASIPLPGGGGCHPAILSVANYGVMDGMQQQAIYDDIRQAIPQGKRRIPDREIWDAIKKAMRDHNGGTFTPRPRPEPTVKDGKAVLQKIISQGKISDERDLREASPIRLLGNPKDDLARFLATLFDPSDLLWIGKHDRAGIVGNTIRTAAEWIIYFSNGGTTAPFIIINPLNGIPVPTKSGDKTTLRGDANVASYRYCMAEFDTISKEDQIRFWCTVILPIVALIDSGGKSIHAWIDAQKLAIVKTYTQWQSEIKGRLYDHILTPLGVDSACSNPSRLSRLPGHYRTEKGAWQRLLWLSAEGRPVCP
jgi:hypothetical protein